MILKRRDFWLVYKKENGEYKTVLELDILTVVMIVFILSAIVLSYNLGQYVSVYYQQQLKSSCFGTSLADQFESTFKLFGNTTEHYEIDSLTKKLYTP